jgi:hypothetical protein
MKRIIISGLIAGVASAIVLIIFQISSLFELFSTTPILGVENVNVQTIAQIEITLGIIWGIIWSVLYAFFYDYIPATGFKKGLVYGLIIWIISGFRLAVMNIPYGYYLHTIPFAISTFFSIAITYGLLIGYLYKPKK